ALTFQNHTNCPLTDLGGKTSIFSHPVYLFLREFSLQDSRGGSIIGGVGGWFGFAHASLESILGYLLAPLAWVMGVDWSDANLAGSLIGQKLAINEFVAYLNFSPYLQTGGTLDAKTVAIISFALCGFVNFGSIGVVVGAFSAVAPHRAPEIAQLGLRALAAATLSNLMSATIAGFFIGLA
ncbi:nucleoside transporter C-terminal domain-containing protein, partial [Escherichia coli]